jgi:hypothetical protein
MTGGPTRRVRFLAEWTEELPVGAALNVGDRITVPAEMAVRRTHEEGVYRNGRKVDTALLAELAPHFVTPGSTWRVRCNLNEGTTGDSGKLSQTRPAELDRESADLGEVLDALAEFAEEQAAKRPWVAQTKVLRGWAEVAAVEPGEGRHSGWNRGIVLTAYFGTLSQGAGLDEFAGALARLCDEAERLNEDGVTNDESA